MLEARHKVVAGPEDALHERQKFSSQRARLRVLVVVREFFHQHNASLERAVVGLAVYASPRGQISTNKTFCLIKKAKFLSNQI